MATSTPAPGTSGVLDSPGARIREVRTTIVNLPLVAPYRWTAGLNHGFSKAIVEVVTEDGHIGLGEASNWRHAAIIDDTFTPRLLGEPATDLHRCRAVAVPPIEALRNTQTGDILRAFGAVEMALLDVTARLLELPLHRLLGGPVRNRVPFTEYFAPRERRGDAGGERTADDVAAYCARMAEEHDSPFFEGKVGYADLDEDVAIAREVRRAIGPDRELRLDANMGWRLPTAHRALELIEPYDIASIEDPASSYEDMARLRERSVIPFSTHAADLRAAVRLGVPDSFVLNLTAFGGIRATLRLIAACAEMGVDYTFYSGETGVGIAAYLQVAAAEPHVRAPSQSLMRWYEYDVIAGDMFQPQEGYLSVPDGPGLGIDLDPAKVEHAHRAYLEDGPLGESGLDVDRDTFNTLPLY